MGAFLIWYATVTALGLLAWPLVFRLLPGLPDRGYSLSRTLGLLLVGYVYWMLVSVGILNNSPGGRAGRCPGRRRVVAVGAGKPQPRPSPPCAPGSPRTAR